MGPELRERLFGSTGAFDHPVTVWIVVAVAALLAVTPAVIWALSTAGKLTPEHRRELWLRYLSWLVIAPALVVPILLGPLWTIAMVALLSLLCYREFARATGLFRDLRVSLVVVLGVLAVTFAALDAWYGLFMAVFPLTAAVLAAAAITEDRPKGFIQRVGLGVFALAFFGAGLGTLGYIANDGLYRPILLTVLLTVELNDVVAYITGRTFGRRKLAPNTSPGKTVAGSLGAVVVTTPLAALLGHFVFEGTGLDRPAPLLALGLIVSVGGQLGDLMLSSIKRDLGIKDFAATIPGHGGLLDRFDSLVLVAPAVFHLVRYYHGIGEGAAARLITGG